MSWLELVMRILLVESLVEEQFSWLLSLFFSLMSVNSSFSTLTAAVDKGRLGQKAPPTKTPPQLMIYSSHDFSYVHYISLTYAAGMRRLRVIIDRRACCFCSHMANVMQLHKNFIYTKAAAWRDAMSDDAEEYKDHGFFWILRPIQTWSLRMCFPHDGCLKLSLEFTHYTCLLAPFNSRRICDFSPLKRHCFFNVKFNCPFEGK